MSHDDHKACYVTYLGEQVQAMPASDIAALKEHRATETAEDTHLLQETGNVPVSIPAEVVTGFLAYIEQVYNLTALAQIVHPQITKYLETLGQMLTYYLLTSVDQQAFVRDCLEHHNHAGEASASPVDSTALLSSLGFTPQEVARLNSIAADHKH